MELNGFLSLMQELAPLGLAEDWDNVGLLLAPETPRDIDKVHLTIDLTQRVLDEVATRGAHALIAYHPPIFNGLKRILPEDRTGGLVLRAAAMGLSIYSPHTALDAVSGGVNDWLCDAFEVTTRRAIQTSSAVPQAGSGSDAGGVTGQGRLARLRSALTIGQAVARLKAHLELQHLRVAAYPGHESAPTIESLALCAGAGGSVVTQVRADLYISGEMRHHDVLAAAQSGTSVILTEHTNSERGYLAVLAARLRERSSLDVSVSDVDADPLRVR